MGLECVGQVTHMETQRAQLPFSLYYQLSSVDGPGRTGVLWWKCSKDICCFDFSPSTALQQLEHHLE